MTDDRRPNATIDRGTVEPVNRGIVESIRLDNLTSNDKDRSYSPL
jgi:hypothetical protein